MVLLVHSLINITNRLSTFPNSVYFELHSTVADLHKSGVRPRTFGVGLEFLYFMRFLEIFGKIFLGWRSILKDWHFPRDKTSGACNVYISKYKCYPLLD